MGEIAAERGNGEESMKKSEKERIIYYIIGFVVGFLCCFIILGTITLNSLNECVGTHAELMKYCSDLLEKVYPR
jgi:hypothetical protein